MKILNVIFLGLLFLNFSFIKSSEYQNNQIRTIFKYKIIRPNNFPEYLYADAVTKDLIDYSTYLQKNIFIQFYDYYGIYQGSWVPNPNYIPHIVIEKLIYLNQ